MEEKGRRGVEYIITDEGVVLCEDEVKEFLAPIVQEILETKMKGFTEAFFQRLVSHIQKVHENLDNCSAISPKITVSKCGLIEIEEKNISKKELIEKFIGELIDKEGEENTIYRSVNIKGIVKYDF